MPNIIILKASSNDIANILSLMEQLGYGQHLNDLKEQINVLV
jgi:hypothetical protein